MTQYHPLYHLVRALSLFGLFIAATLVALLTVNELTATGIPQSDANALTVFFDLYSILLLAVLAWSGIEFTAFVWGIPAGIQRLATQVKNKLGGST